MTTQQTVLLACVFIRVDYSDQLGGTRGEGHDSTFARYCDVVLRAAVMGKSETFGCGVVNWCCKLEL
jgi:hypothetical protein